MIFENFDKGYQQIINEFDYFQNEWRHDRINCKELEERKKQNQKLQKEFTIKYLKTTHLTTIELINFLKKFHKKYWWGNNLPDDMMWKTEVVDLMKEILHKNEFNEQEWILLYLSYPGLAIYLVHEKFSTFNNTLKPWPTWIPYHDNTEYYHTLDKLVKFLKETSLSSIEIIAIIHELRFFTSNTDDVPEKFEHILVQKLDQQNPSKELLEILLSICEWWEDVAFPNEPYRRSFSKIRKFAFNKLHPE